MQVVQRRADRSDCIFPRGRGRNVALINGNGPDEGDQHDDAAIDIVPDTPSSPMVGGSHDLAPSTVTLSGLLNAIDGVSSQVSSKGAVSEGLG